MNEVFSNDDIIEFCKQFFDILCGVCVGIIDLDVVRVVNEIGKIIIDLVKVEVDFFKVNGGGESDFFVVGILLKGNLLLGIMGVRCYLIKQMKDVFSYEEDVCVFDCLSWLFCVD